MKKAIQRIGWFLVVITTIAFSFKNILEPDIWWQLAAGEWMLNSHSILRQDVFSFTFSGVNWMNIKWGYECFIAIYVRFFSPELLPLIQAFVSCLMVYFIVKTGRVYADKIHGITEKVAILIGILLFLLVSEYRMNTRPEMFSHLFTAIMVYLLANYIHNKKKHLIWLIPMQWIWSNVHDGYVVGLTITLVFLVVYWFRYLNNEGTEKPMYFTWIWLGMLAATCVNPYGYHLLFKGFNILHQIKETKYTTEFLDYSSYQFWTKESYIALCIFGLVFLVYLFRIFRMIAPEISWKGVVDLVNLDLIFPLLLMGSFSILALMAYRNMIFLAIVCIPHFIHVVEYLLNRIQQRVVPYLYVSFLGIYIIVYAAIVSQHYYSFTNSKNRFGLEVVSVNHPIRTASFLNEQHLFAPVFSDYINSSYLLYALRPNFKSFIDLRDYEIYTPDFFDTYANAINNGESFMKLDSTYGFKAVVLLTKQQDALHRFLYHHPVYHLTHLDAVCAVYEKRELPNVPYTQSEAMPQSELAKILNHVFNPVYQTYSESTDADWERAAQYYLKVGDLDHAQFYISQINDRATYGELKGTYFLNTYQKDTSAQAVLYIDSATTCFTNAIQLNSKSSASYFGMASIYYLKQQYKSAIKYWEESLRKGENNLQAHLYLADCFEKLADGGNAKANYQAEIEHLLEAYRLNPNNPFIETDLGFIYAKLNQCDQAVYYLEKIKDFEGLNAADKQTAKQYIQDCKGR